MPILGADAGILREDAEVLFNERMDPISAGNQALNDEIVEQVAATNLASMPTNDFI